MSKGGWGARRGRLRFFRGLRMRWTVDKGCRVKSGRHAESRSLLVIAASSSSPHPAITMTVDIRFHNLNRVGGKDHLYVVPAMNLLLSSSRAKYPLFFSAFPPISTRTVLKESSTQSLFNTIRASSKAGRHAIHLFTLSISDRVVLLLLDISTLSSF